MKNRGKFSATRQINNKAQNDDDNCSVICYKDSDDGHIGVVRIRQQPVCSACNLMRGTLSLYYKHVLENNHRENVKKQCDENRFLPSIYDQAIHLAFHNNFYYQSDKFHFLYKHTNEEPNSSSLPENQSSANIRNESEKNERTNNQQKSIAINTRKRRNLQVTLVFQDKTYSQIGTNTNQIREQLLKKMIADRASDIAALPMEIYYIKKKIASDNIHHNAQKSSVIFTMAKDQSQVLLKNQQQREPFENGDMSSATNSSKDNGVEQNTIITTHEISKTEKIDVDEPPSFVDDVINVCKDVLNTIILDIYSKCGELKREQQFLSGIARRSFKKKNTFFCDICSIFLTSEKYCIQHLNGSDHLEKIRNYQTNFLPWRQAIQESIVNGKSMKDIMRHDAYEKYKTTMGHYLAPNSLSNRGRFCCAYCELVLTDQWALEKHLHTNEHKEKETSSDHKNLIVHFSNIVIIPSIFKLNGITQLSEIPDDIKNRYQWRRATCEQLDEDTNSFLRNYPFDSFEGATRIVNVRQPKKQKSSTIKSTTQNLRNNNANNKNSSKGKIQPKKRSGLNNTYGGKFQTSTSHRGATAKRSFHGAGSSNKRFRGDLNNSFPGANRAPGPIRNYATNRYSYDRPRPYHNDNDRWSDHRSVDQRQEEFFERSNYELQSLASNTNRYYTDRPAQLMSTESNYEREQQSRFNSNISGRYNDQQSNYDPNFIRAVAKAVAEYQPEPNSIPRYSGSSHRSHQRSNTGPSNEFIHQVGISIQRSQQQLPVSIMSQGSYQNSNALGGFRANHNNNNSSINSSYFSNVPNQQQTQMGNNVPSVRSYADYRSSTGPSVSNVSSSMYTPLINSQNPVVSQAHTYNDYNRSSLAHNSSNTFGRSGGSSFNNEEPRYTNFGHQNQMESSSWRGSSSGGNHGQANNQFQSLNKQPGSTFSYSSTQKNNNNVSMRGREANRNSHSFGSRF